MWCELKKGKYVLIWVQVLKSLAGFNCHMHMALDQDYGPHSSGRTYLEIFSRFNGIFFSKCKFIFSNTIPFNCNIYGETGPMQSMLLL